MQRRIFVCGWVAATLPAVMIDAVSAADATPFRVVASFSILADLVREIGGVDVEVRSLVPAGADAHVFTPTPADAAVLAQAQLVVVNGLRHEGWLARLVKAAGYRDELLVASNGVKVRQTRGGADPHAWQNLANVQTYVENIRAGLVARLPGRSAAINQRAAAYKLRLVELDAKTRERLAKLPKEARRVITGHDAFGYFADAYGVVFTAPRGWSTDSEPSAQSVAAIVRQLRQQRAGALLVEQRGDPRLLERIAAESGTRVGGHLYADSLSPPGGEADTFLRLFGHNVDTLIEAMTPIAAPSR